MYSQSTVGENLNVEQSPSAGTGLRASERHAGQISIFFLITSLEVGGAQMMLYKLLSGMDPTRFRVQVVSLIDLDLGGLREKFETIPVQLRSLGMRPGIPNPACVLRLARWLRADRPAVLSTWMYHADLIGGLAAKLAGGIPVVWGIRQGDLSREGNRWLTLQTVKACALMSRWLPARIICNAEASRKVHAAAGYEAEKMIVIPNGSDLTMFKPDEAARRLVRKELEIPEESPIIGLVGRFHPYKDHHNFIRAAALLYRDWPDVHFLLCGDEITSENPHLAAWIRDAGISGRCRLVGRRHDIPRLTAALDIAVSSSFGESFSSVVVEAMSCGIPCVVTDVGDSAFIVGQTGLVVPPQNARELANALRQLIELGHNARISMGMAARCRIQKHFDLPNIVSRYQDLYEELAVVSRCENRSLQPIAAPCKSVKRNV